MSEVVWNKYSKEEFENVMKFSDGYIDFLSDSKTERACVKNAIALAKSYGYRDIKEVIENKEILRNFIFNRNSYLETDNDNH